VFAAEGPEGSALFGVLPHVREMTEADLGAPITQATAHGNNVVAVYADRVELRSGWQGQNVEVINLRDVSAIRIQGLINCTLTLVSNTGRVYQFERMALPDARGIRSAIERQKQKAGLYE
jgi:hypothetical protein